MFPVQRYNLFYIRQSWGTVEQSLEIIAKSEINWKRLSELLKKKMPQHRGFFKSSSVNIPMDESNEHLTQIKDISVPAVDKYCSNNNQNKQCFHVCISVIVHITYERTCLVYHLWMKIIGWLLKIIWISCSTYAYTWCKFNRTRCSDKCHWFSLCRSWHFSINNIVLWW